MSLFINGTIPKEDKDYIKEYLDYLIYVSCIENGSSKDLVQYRKGWSNIHTIIKL